MKNKKEAQEIFLSVEDAFPSAELFLCLPDEKSSVMVDIHKGIFTINDLELILQAMKKIEALNNGKMIPDELESAFSSLEKAIESWGWKGGKRWIDRIRLELKIQKKESLSA